MEMSLFKQHAVMHIVCQHYAIPILTSNLYTQTHKTFASQLGVVHKQRQDDENLVQSISYHGLWLPFKGNRSNNDGRRTKVQGRGMCYMDSGCLSWLRHP